MFGTVILDVAIGLIFLYLTLSLLGSALAELIELSLRARSRTLEKGLRQLLFDADGTGLALELYKHPLIMGLSKQPTGSDPKSTDEISRYKLPSYIPAKLFASALLDIVNRKGGAQALGLDLDTLKSALASLGNENVRRALEALLPPKAQAEARNIAREVTEYRRNVESWFDNTMERVSGWYKKRTQWLIFGIGLVLSLVFNADSIHAVQVLSHDQVLRDSLVTAAQQYLNAHPPPASPGGAAGQSTAPQQPGAQPAAQPSDTEGAPAETAEISAQELRQRLQAVQKGISGVRGLGLPLGWSAEEWKQLEKTWYLFLVKLLGLLLTAAAVSLGAPFWFDLLNKIAMVRSALKPEEKAPEQTGT